MPSVVPNENVALVIVVADVTPGTSSVNVAVPSRNGLCGLLPAIEPFALLYTSPGPDGPIIRCAGPAPPNTSSCNPPATPSFSSHPVATLLPSVNVPFFATVISCPELELSAPVVAP